MPTTTPAPGDTLTWIFGSSRSGSTWLLRMLSEIGGVAPIDDPHIGHHLGVWRPIPLAWATADERPELGTLREFKADHDGYFFADRYREAWQPALRDLIEARFGAQAADVAADEQGRRHVVVKEPGSQAADLLIELFPRSTLIFLLRDGRDVVDSWLDAYSDGSWAIREGAFPVAESGRLALIEWLSTVWATRTRLVRELYEAHDEDRRVMIRYEDMRRDPGATLRDICSAIGIEPGAAELDRIAEQHAFERVEPERRGSGKEIRAARPGGWRDSLSDEEREAAHAIMGPALVESGYEADPPARLSAA